MVGITDVPLAEGYLATINPRLLPQNNSLTTDKRLAPSLTKLMVVVRSFNNKYYVLDI